MKKLLAIILGTLLVMGFAASAFAIHAEIPAETQAVVAKGSTQITIGGEIRTRGWWRTGLGSVTYNDVYRYNLDFYDDLWDLNDVLGGTTNIVQSTASLSGMPIKKSFVYNDIKTYNWEFYEGSGDYIYFDYWQTWRDEYSESDTHRSSAWWDQRVRLWVEAKVSPNVMGYVQLETTSSSDGDKYKWGNGEASGELSKASSGVGGTNTKPDGTINILQAWIQYTGSGLFGFPSGFKIGHMPLKLAYGQFFDNTQYGDDALVFFMDPTKQLHIGLLTFKGTEGSIADNTDDIDAYAALMMYKINNDHNIGVNYTYLNGSDLDLQMQNLGLHADGKFGNFGYKAAVDFQFGDFGEDDGADFGGWAFQTFLNYKMNDVNLRGSFRFGSGDSDDDDNDLDEFVAFNGNIANIALIYEYQVRTAAFNESGLNSPVSSDGHSSGIANTTVYNLGVDWQATKDLGLGLDGYIFRASKTPNGISKSVGWEVDAKMVYKLAKNLTYQFDAGYFNAGGFYEDLAEDFADRYNFDDDWEAEAANIWTLRHMLTLSF